MKKREFCLFLLLFLALLFVSVNAKAQELTDGIKNDIGNYLTSEVSKQIYTGKVKVDSVYVDKKQLKLFVNSSLSNIAFDKGLVDNIYASVKDMLPENLRKHKIELYSDRYKIEDYIPFNRKERFAHKKVTPLVTNLSHPYIVNAGLQDRHIAMWQSHGWYYEQKLARWEWQRARIYQTVEDLYTQSYVLPYLVPMLENAGANVLLPRERDIQRHEVIVDNDKSGGKSEYDEVEGIEPWSDGENPGFANQKDFYVDGENPFRMGTFRQAKTVTKDAESLAQWIPYIPEKGRYAVYVSYKTVKNSSEDVRYTVYHLGGKTEFSVNQTMGGGTWIFLGFFGFGEGRNDNCKIVLSNKSDKKGRIVTADAVKIGGGMGNIARMPHADGSATENTKSSENLETAEVTKLPQIEYTPETSTYPRYTEGARYWLQWAGAPDSVYTWSKGKNDYTDDYQSRGLWVNYMAGGSSVLPKKEGLGIPFDMSMAFHSDAGTTFNDSIIGTLGICMTHHNDEKFANGKPRILSRDLTAAIMDEIVNDIRADYEPKWTRRQIWNRSYSEARIPEVPSMLLELLSHQNLADMKYGLDPRFQFTVSRSIYKGILKFMAHQYEYDYVVQPLPVEGFGAQFEGDKTVNIKWICVNDRHEPTATPKAYVLYTRVGDGDFDNGILLANSETSIDIEKDKIYSFKVTAVNEGGESFPSEILSVCRKSNEEGSVLVVNGFTRVSAPMSFASSDSIGGFLDFIDHGVPDKVQYNYTGSQYEFRRWIPWMDDDAAGFGASNGNYEVTPLAGNTFDYPYVHGLAIVNAGYSFISASSDAAMRGQVNLNDFKMVDLILGKQKQTKIGTGVFGAKFKTFPAGLQQKITEYCNAGGNIFVSGAYVATDLWDNGPGEKSDREFANNVLRYKWRVGQAAVTGSVKTVVSPFKQISGNFSFYNQLNSVCYAVEAPDAIEPYGDGSFTAFRYSENNLSAGVVSSGMYKTFILGFPFETIKDAEGRNQMMKNVLDFMYEK